MIIPTRGTIGVGKTEGTNCTWSEQGKTLSIVKNDEGASIGLQISGIIPYTLPNIYVDSISKEAGVQVDHLRLSIPTTAYSKVERITVSNLNAKDLVINLEVPDTKKFTVADEGTNCSYSDGKFKIIDTDKETASISISSDEAIKNLAINQEAKDAQITVKIDIADLTKALLTIPKSAYNTNIAIIISALNTVNLTITLPNIGTITVAPEDNCEYNSTTKRYSILNKDFDTKLKLYAVESDDEIKVSEQDVKIENGIVTIPKKFYENGTLTLESLTFSRPNTISQTISFDLAAPITLSHFIPGENIKYNEETKDICYKIPFTKTNGHFALHISDEIIARSGNLEWECTVGGEIDNNITCAITEFGPLLIAVTISSDHETVINKELRITCKNSTKTFAVSVGNLSIYPQANMTFAKILPESKCLTLKDKDFTCALPVNKNGLNYGGVFSLNMGSNILTEQKDNADFQYSIKLDGQVDNSAFCSWSAAENIVTVYLKKDHAPTNGAKKITITCSTPTQNFIWDEGYTLNVTQAYAYITSETESTSWLQMSGNNIKFRRGGHDGGTFVYGNVWFRSKNFSKPWEKLAVKSDYISGSNLQIIKSYIGEDDLFILSIDFRTPKTDGYKPITIYCKDPNLCFAEWTGYLWVYE